MSKKLFSFIKSFLKPAIAIGLVLTLVLGNADGALAARTGGRIGGGSFSVPSRSYSSPRTYAPSPGYYPGGGGFGFPFLIPFFGIGGGFGGLFTILIFIAIANFLLQSFRRIGAGETSESLGYSSNPTVSVARLQVGLLANARSLQAELNNIAETADTGTPQGRAEVLQEASLALMRHPEYWVYGGTESQQARLESAEAQFNRLSLAERSKFTAETLSNVNNILRGSEAQKALPGEETAAPGEYIVVTLLAATLGKVELPKVNSTEDLGQALRQFGGIPSDRLLAMEILWTPQAEGDTLTSEDIIVEYPHLKLV
ncbi:MAG TPA: DUF1517 domain-containing protein [Leptolyngbyaceae cyanobacterium]